MTTPGTHEPKIAIRFATAGDMPWLKQNDKAISSAILEKKIFDKEILVATADSTKAAWLRFSFFWDTLPFVNTIGVDADHRRQKIGTKLLLHWEGMMKAEGFRKVLVATLSSERAQHFFRHLEYQDCGSLILPQAPLEIIMMKKLPQKEASPTPEKSAPAAG